MLGTAGLAAADVKIHGVSEGQVVSDKLYLHAEAIGRTNGVVIQMMGPNGLRWRNSSDDQKVPLFFEPGEMHEPLAWDPSDYPEGGYRVFAFNMVRGRVEGVAQVKFRVKHAEPEAAAPAPGPAPTPTPPATEIPSEPISNDPEPVDQADSVAEPTPAVSGLPSVSFGSGTPSQFVLGSTESMFFEVDGTLPEGGDVLIIAWHHDQAKVIDSFGHTQRKDPWTISASKLNLLPPGNVELQLQPRHDGKVKAKTVHQLKVLPKPVVVDNDPEPEPELAQPDTPPAPEDDDASAGTDDDNGSGGAVSQDPADNDPDAPLSLAFSESTPDVYTRGSGQPISLDFQGTLPEGGDVLLLSWSHTDQEMVGGFAHALTEGPFEISTTKLDALPSGKIELQTHLRLPSADTVVGKRTITVIAPGENPAQFAGDDEPREEPPVDNTPLDLDDVARTEAGFTKFTKSGDTRVIYVSSSTGNDNNDGRSPGAAVKTAQRGYDLLRSGSPDWLLFKRGDTFNHGLPTWKKSGKNSNEKMLVSSYGNGARPHFKVPSEHFARSWGTVRHVAFVGLHAHAVNRDPSQPGFKREPSQRPAAVRDQNGFYWLAGGGDILVEDCLIEWFKFNLVFQNVNDGFVQDIQIRRNILLNAYGHWDKKYGGHASGLYASKVKGMTLVENVFDSNGAHDDIPGAVPTKFNHNIYVQYDCSDITAVGNILSRGASHGAQFRAGADVDNNLFVGNSLAFFVAREESRVTRNVVLQSNDLSSNESRGFGIEVLPCRVAVVENNIVSQKKGSLREASAIHITWEDGSMQFTGGQYDVYIRNNKIYNWPVAGSYDKAITIHTGAAKIRANSGNQLDRSSGGSENPPWVDPTRDVESYMKSIGKTASLDAFIEGCASRPAGQWFESFSADAVNTHIRQGFSIKLYD
jgi:hypothetical protein